MATVLFATCGLALSACNVGDDEDIELKEQPATECPESRPDAGALCSGDLHCSYGTTACNTTLVDCRDGKWEYGFYMIQCPTPDTSCPESAPARDGACSGDLHCTYGSNPCDTIIAHCQDKKWQLGGYAIDCSRKVDLAEK